MKRTERDPLIHQAVLEVHLSGRKPTSRNVLMHMNPGKTQRDFLQGMNSRDVIVFRDAMRSIGYQQKPNGRWHWPQPLLPVGLDEVRCTMLFCPNYTPGHTMADHEVEEDGHVTIQLYQREMYSRVMKYAAHLFEGDSDD